MPSAAQNGETVVMRSVGKQAAKTARSIGKKAEKQVKSTTKQASKTARKTVRWGFTAVSAGLRFDQIPDRSAAYASFGVIVTILLISPT